MNDTTRKLPGFLSIDDVRQFEEQAIRKWEESFPKPGDRMFVPSASGAHIDPIKLGDPARPGERPSTGR